MIIASLGVMFWKQINVLLLTILPPSVFRFIRFLKNSFSAIAGGLVMLWSWRLSKKKRNRHVDGFVEPGFERVAETFKLNVMTGNEMGAGFAVYYKGKLVVDLWGGYADLQARRLWEKDTISVFYSVTKAMTAIAMNILVDRGLLDYDKRVSDYWPEFAQNGKQDITVGQLLSHQAGILSIEESYQLAWARDDPERLATALAAQKPLWPPGKAQGYHALTYGLCADRLVRLVDKKQRSLAQFFQEEIAKPLDLDLSIGLDKQEYHRTTRQHEANFGWRYFFTTFLCTGIAFLARCASSVYHYGQVFIMQFIDNPTDWRPRKLNDPKFLDIPSGASHGIGTPRSLAKLLNSLLMGDGPKGKSLVSKDTYDKLKKPLSSQYDLVIMKHLTYGPGMLLSNIEPKGMQKRTVFGHWGAGGQMAFADDTSQLAWAYITNFSNILHGFVIDHRYQNLVDALYECTKDLEHSKLKAEVTL